MEILTDDTPSDISYTLTAITTDPAGAEIRTIVATETDFGPNLLQDFYYHNLDPDAKFELVVNDDGGDGICCSHGRKGHILVHEVDNHKPDMIVTELVTSTNGNYGAQWFPEPFYLPSFHPTWWVEKDGEKTPID